MDVPPNGKEVNTIENTFFTHSNYNTLHGRLTYSF